MADEVRLAKADLKRPAAAVPVTMHGLWRLVVWGSTPPTGVLIAVVSRRGGVGSQRAPAVTAALVSRGVVGSQRAAVAASTLGAATVAVVQPVQTPPQTAAHA